MSRPLEGVEALTSKIPGDNTDTLAIRLIDHLGRERGEADAGKAITGYSTLFPAKL